VIKPLNELYIANGDANKAVHAVTLTPRELQTETDNNLPAKKRKYSHDVGGDVDCRKINMDEAGELESGIKLETTSY
jgi:hypothetical protein